MELRQYGRILMRRWWLLLLLPLLAAAFSLLTYSEAPPTYAATLDYSVSFMPVPLEVMVVDPRLGAVQASEYIADDLTKVLVGSRFAEYVSQYLDSDLAVGAIASATRTSKEHRIVTIDLSAPTLEATQALTDAVKQAVERDLLGFLQEAWGNDDLRLELVNDSGAVELSNELRSKLEVPLRAAVALVAAIALAFALDYLDSSVRSRDEVERLVGPVLGEIPETS